jgi:hypothetical protein
MSNFRAPTEQAPSLESFTAALDGAREAQDRRRLVEGVVETWRRMNEMPKASGFALMPPERRREVSAKGNAARRAAPKVAKVTNVMAHYGLTPAEFADYGIIRAKGFGQAEAVEIILRSRHPTDGAA